MARMDDADAHGFVDSLARPRGNVAGLSFQNAELTTKWLQLLKEAVPRLARVAVLWDPLARPRRPKRGLPQWDPDASAGGPGAARLPWAFEAARKAEADGVVILGSPNFTNGIPQLAELASQYRLPALYFHRRFAEAGGLMAYGPSESDFTAPRGDVRRQDPEGRSAGDLPVEQPSSFDLVINLKAARTLGLSLPQTLLIQATHVIQ